MKRFLWLTLLYFNSYCSYFAIGQTYETVFQFIARNNETNEISGESSITSQNINGKPVIIEEYYLVNGVRITKYMYEQNQNAFKKRSSSNLIPYRLVTFDLDSIKMSDCLMKGFCYYGFYYEFHPNGKLKIRGEYHEMTLEELNAKNMNYGDCNPQKVGKWIFYDKNGNETHSEIYIDGQKM